MNKLVTGHNLDDEAEAIMLNFIKGDVDRMARTGIGEGFVMDSGFVPRIKPLREAPKEEVTLYSKLEGIKTTDLKCPYITSAFRKEVRDILNTLEEKHPGTKTAILKSLDRISGSLKKSRGSTPKRCSVCGEPCSGSMCKACSLLKNL